MRKLHCGYQGVILYLDLVMVLVFLLQSPEDGNGLCRCRFVHHHHLEPSFQGLVRLEVFLVFVKRGGPDGPQFTSRKSRFEDIGCIHGSRCTSCAYQSVDFIYEKNDFPVAVDDFLDYTFKPFLKFSLIFRTRYKCTQIQRIDFLVFKVFRDIAIHDVLGNAFRNGRLSHTRLTYQYRVVLGPSAQNLKDTPDFLISSDDRVKLSLRCLLIQVDSELFQIFKFIVFHIFFSFYHSISICSAGTQPQVCRNAATTSEYNLQ